MLRLDKIEVSGFKSFSDRTEVRLPIGITAVVGPNGCGKSNIGDALNWALGEQSPKMLRGKQMADVIFAGTTARKPLGLAEVSLHFIGAEGLNHQDQGRIVITRRLFRSGESEYQINGKRTRLKDIQELLHEARVGARTYATIEQGRIDQILNAKPKERRLLIEDAAGVANYKHKRRLTEMKLEATQANLLRVNDIVIEVERQIRSLKRQASKARRYRRLREELRGKERVRFGLRASELDEELRSLRAEEERAKDTESRAAATLSRLEVELTERREALEQANRVFRSASERLHALEIEIDREEGRIDTCRERVAEADQIAQRQSEVAEELARRHGETAAMLAEGEARLARQKQGLERATAEFSARQAVLDEIEHAQRVLRDEIESLRRSQFSTMNRAVEARNRLRSISEDLERNEGQTKRLEEERAAASADWTRLREETDDLGTRLQRQVERAGELQAACDDSAERLRQARQRLSEERDALAASREGEQSAGARLRTLEDVSTRFAGVSDGVPTLLAGGGAAGVRALGVVADFIEARTEMESVAEGYLQSFLPAVIVEDDGDVQRAAELLRSAGAGRTSLISRSQPAGRPAVGVSGNGRGDLPPELFADPRVRGRLRDGLTLRSSSNGAVQERLGDAVLVDSLESALALHRTYPSVDYLTPDGDVVYASGVVSAGGRPNGDQGLLAHTRQMEEARARADEASSRSGVLQERVEACLAEVDRLEAELAERRRSLEEATRHQVELELLGQRTSDESERSARRTDVLDAELAGLQEELQRLVATRAELQRTVEESESSHRAVEQQLHARVAQAAQRDEEHKRLFAEVADLKADLAAKRQREESSEQEHRRLADEEAELRSRVAATRAEIDAARLRSKEASELRERTEAELLKHLAEGKQLRARSVEMEREIVASQEQLGDRERTLRGVRAELESHRAATREKELARTRCEEARRHLDDLCMQELGVSATRAAADAGEQMQGVDIERLEEEIEQAREKIERIGPVNMTAIEEFSELEERHGFLTAQREDLEQSMVSLRETIRRINRTSRERFNTAFEAIRLNFQETFKVLFRGGRADLQLEEEEDVLEAGVEMLAQPPGKRLGSIQLLSGGEKALSAIALLFAIFRHQPSPFCLLDEVDAALDDANVGRFIRMIAEYAAQTQFIIVTHNKLTMESADLLYGVTMEEPGISRIVSLEMH